jgi:pimeloyl-ACP methyl ester carboxylesterase
MARRVPIRASDLRGAARLATDASAGLIDLVEALHERIAHLPGMAPPDGRTQGITGLVYKTVRGVTRVVGGGVDALLGLLAPGLGPDDPVPQREALIAALNGVVGDYLAATANPLAIRTALRRDGRPLQVDAAALATRLPDAGSRVLVMLHGLCMNDLQWSRGGHEHGAALRRDLDFTPVYLHYNSGVHVSINGRALAQHLEELIDRWPQPVERLALVGHSMGGLVARSATHYGMQAGHRWPALLRDTVFLGTPHHGAALERAGNWVDIVLGATPYAAPFARLGKLRSAGITDLRHGNLLDEDWEGGDRYARSADRRRHVPLPPHVRCCAVAACLGQPGGGLKQRLLGDGLVPLDSALGRHRNPARCLDFAEDRQWIGYRMNHMDLLNHPEVYARLLRWLAADHAA